MNLLFRKALINDPASPWHGRRVDVMVAQGVIEAIDPNLQWEGPTVTSADLWLSPGWMDMRAHFCDPGEEHREDLESGSALAAAGGYTDVLLLPNTQPVIQDKNDIHYLRAGNARRVAQLWPCAAVTRDAAGKELTEMIDLHHAGALAFGDGLHPLANADILLKTLLYLQPLGAVLIDQPEDHYLSLYGTMHEGYQSTLLGLKGVPPLAEELSIQRNLQLLAYAEGRLHFSCLSTQRGVELIRQAKTQGLHVSSDVALANLLFDDQALESFDTVYKVKPVLRSHEHQEALLQGLEDGTIDAIVSNHVPLDQDAKRVEFDAADFGMGLLQTMLPGLLRLSSRLSPELLLHKVSAGPRQILGLEQPRIEVGQAARLTAFDPVRTWKLDANTSYSKSLNNPFFGQTLRGRVLATINGTQCYLHSDEN